MSSLDNIRRHYQKVRNKIMTGQVGDLELDQIAKYRKQCDNEIKRCTQQQDFQHLAQIQFYQERFAKLEQRMGFYKKQSSGCFGKTPKGLDEEAKRLFREQSYRAPSMGNKQSIDGFFDQKRSVLNSQTGYQSVLQNPPVASRTFKKRVGGSQQIRRLQEQNNQLRERLARGGFSSDQRQRYEDQSRRKSERIRQLERQNQKLLIYSKGSSVGSSSLRSEDGLYAPYIINPLENDLYKINVKNQSESGYSNHDQFSDQPEDYENYGDYRDNYSQQGSFSVFDATKSYYTEVDYNPNKTYGIDDKKTAVRNKKAFLKPQGIIVKNQELQIGYKKSDSDSARRQKIILYFYNKSGMKKQIKCDYLFQRTHYRLDVRQKISSIADNKQDRQVVEVEFIGDYYDSVIQVEAHVDSTLYKLWLPAMFLGFTYQKVSVTDYWNRNKQQTRTVSANKNFASIQQAQRLIPEMTTMGHQGIVHTKQGGTIKMKWKDRNRIQISASERYLYMMTFLLSDQKP